MYPSRYRARIHLWQVSGPSNSTHTHTIHPKEDFEAPLNLNKHVGEKMQTQKNPWSNQDSNPGSAKEASLLTTYCTLYGWCAWFKAIYIYIKITLNLNLSEVIYSYNFLKYNCFFMFSWHCFVLSWSWKIKQHCYFGPIRIHFALLGASSSRWKSSHCRIVAHFYLLMLLAPLVKTLSPVPRLLLPAGSVFVLLDSCWTLLLLQSALKLPPCFSFPVLVFFNIFNSAVCVPVLTTCLAEFFPGKRLLRIVTDIFIQ